jgi:GxxExxY protein
MALLKEVNEKVYKIIGSCMEVHKTLGPGYPVEFYNKALEVEMPLRELSFERDKTIQVNFKDTLVGTLSLDFFVDGKVVLITRSQEGLKDFEIQQVLRCLSLTGSPIGVLVNFGQLKIQYKRVLPSHQQREIRKDHHYRYTGYREIGKTREGNPVI